MLISLTLLKNFSLITRLYFLPIPFFSIFFFRNANCLHWLNYGSFVVSWEIRKSESFNLVLYKDCVGSSCPLHFHINLWINLPISAKKKRATYFDRDWVEFVGNLRSNCHLNKLSLLIHDHGVPFYLFRFSFISFNTDL